MAKKLDLEYDNRVGPEIFGDNKKNKNVALKISILILSCLAGFQGATQYIANEFNYHPELGV